MSVRAYLVKEIKFAEGASFNLWHDEAVMDWLEGNTDFYSRLNGDGNGMTEVSVGHVERMLAELGDKIDCGTRDAMQGDIAWAKAKGDNWLEYECF
jgi:hypothetical protein